MLKFFRLWAILVIVAIPAQSAEAKSVNMLTLVTWNIQVGSDQSYTGNGWAKRKLALLQVLRSVEPDVICTQEGLPAQIQYLSQGLTTYSFTGVGRDDGKDAGEHCTIFFRKSRLELLQSGTFWLSDTPDTPNRTWDGMYKRICSYGQFLDRVSGKKFFVFCTHFPLNPGAQPKSARLVARKIAELCGDSVVFLAGDFNCGPDSEAWKIFEQSALSPSNQTHKTYHVFGQPLLCLDTVFTSGSVAIIEQRVLNEKVNGVWPSDHFGFEVKATMETLAPSR